MKLRARIALTLALSVVPFVVGLALFQVMVRRNQIAENTAQFVLGRLDDRTRARCESAPESWPNTRFRPHNDGHRDRDGVRRARRRAKRFARRLGPPPRRDAIRGAQLFAYDASFESRRPDAPPLHADLIEEILDGEAVATRYYEAGKRTYLEALVRMPWAEGPCALMLVQRPAPEAAIGIAGVARSLVPSMVITLAAVIIAVLVVAPVERRIRRLTEAVRRTKAPSSLATDLGGADEVHQLAEAIDEARARIEAQVTALEQRDAALTTYIANTTHDVMVPLTVLSGHLARMERAVREGEPIERDRMRGALDEAHYMASLLHNLNAAARLRAGGEQPLDLHQTSLIDIVSRVVERHRPVARAAGVELDFAIPDEPIVVACDVTLLEQAISNLVHNAVRHNRQGGHVALLLHRESDERFLLEVIDDGPGIAPDELARVFDRHHRGGEARTRHPNGLGIGLSIAKDVAERHGYELTLRNQPEGGLRAALRGRIV